MVTEKTRWGILYCPKHGLSASKKDGEKSRIACVHRILISILYKVKSRKELSGS